MEHDKEDQDAARVDKGSGLDDGCCHKTRIKGALCPIGRKCPYDSAPEASASTTDKTPTWLQKRLDDVTVGGQTSEQIDREYAVQEMHSYLDAEVRDAASITDPLPPYTVTVPLIFKGIKFVCEVPYQLGPVKDIALCRNQLIIACDHGICAWDLDTETMKVLSPY